MYIAIIRHNYNVYTNPFIRVAIAGESGPGSFSIGRPKESLNSSGEMVNDMSAAVGILRVMVTSMTSVSSSPSSLPSMKPNSTTAVREREREGEGGGGRDDCD